MVRIVGVRFKPAGKMYYFDPLGFDINRGDKVIVETSRGVEYGEAVFGIKEVEDDVIVKPLKGVLRLANDEDTQRFNENKEKEREAFEVCADKIRKHKLDMKLVEVEYTFDGSKILFYFTADGRVDFRELVKDLAAVFRTRIELRQIGVRDESKTLGSVGMCGRNLCCSQFLGEFVPVSIKMAKEQGLSLNPTKISGACGRLMCCLKYEQDTYEELIRQSPRYGAVVMTPDGKGTVTNVELLRGKVKVRFGNGEDSTLKDYAVADVKPYDDEKNDEDTDVLSEPVQLSDSLDEQKSVKRQKRRPKSNNNKTDITAEKDEQEQQDNAQKAAKPNRRRRNNRKKPQQKPQQES